MHPSLICYNAVRVICHEKIISLIRNLTQPIDIDMEEFQERESGSIKINFEFIL